MARPKNRTAPKYRHHKPSGKVSVVINGKYHYLGKYNSPESRRKYKHLIATLWLAEPDPEPLSEKPKCSITVSLLAVEYAKAKYRLPSGKQKNEWAQIQRTLREVRANYGDLLASDFGPLKFEEFRSILISRGLAKHTVKRYSNYVKKMYQRGVKLELISVELYQRLEAVGPVEMPYKPPKKILPVDLDIVRQTQRELTSVVSDMVEIQLLTAMRPNEVCNLRPCDIDRSGDIWLYEPPSHKTMHHGKGRCIPLGPKAQSVLSRYLNRDPQAFCFSPSDAYHEHFENRRSNRVTPEGCGNGPRPRKQKSFSPNYDHGSYRRAVQRAAARAFPMPSDIDPVKWKSKYIWSPNQLRHSTATHARKNFDLETSQVILGHSSKQTTERYYAEADLSKAVKYAQKFG